EIGHTAGGDDWDVDALCQAHRGFDVHPAEHAVAADIGVDDGFHTVVLEFPCQVDDIMTGELAPTVGGDFAVARVQADNDVARESATGVAQKAGVFHGGRADNDIGNAVIEVRLYGVEVTDSTADLDGDVAVDRRNNGFNGRGVFGLAGHGAVQIYQVQAACALV